jgi:aryl-alcohol dehydrogenase-like predicted oxidoreductase
VIPRRRLTADYSISRIIKGGWHLAGGHGEIDPDQAVRDMAQFVEAGITTFDCADIYTGVEALIGEFRRAYPSLAPAVQIHTKFVPDLSDLQTVGRRKVEAVIDRSLRRLGVERLDVVQFHWWDFEIPRYVETALELDRLRVAGKIAHVGATNFDVDHLGQLLDVGVPILTHQIQYSLLDGRPEPRMAAFCADHDIALLCYGTVAGGFLSGRWLGQPEPGRLQNRSLIKYKLIIDDFGGWGLFQDLLRCLDAIAVKHDSDIASVASRLVLDKPAVAAVIIGATSDAHLARHAELCRLALDDEDRQAVERILQRRRGPAGDVYALERDRNGPHGRIMKYELNRRPEETAPHA